MAATDGDRQPWRPGGGLFTVLYSHRPPPASTSRVKITRVAIQARRRDFCRVVRSRSGGRPRGSSSCSVAHRGRQLAPAARFVWGVVRGPEPAGGGVVQEAGTGEGEGSVAACRRGRDVVVRIRGRFAGGTAGTATPVRAARSARRKAAASWKRSARFFCSAFARTLSSASETSGFTLLAGSGISRTCWYATETGLSPMNGGRPVSIS